MIRLVCGYLPHVHTHFERTGRGSALDAWSGTAVAVGVAGALALVAIAMGWRGSDLPAQVFRAELFRRNGFVLWNSQWFAGHPTLDYSVLSPVLSALTGPIVLGAASGVVSALLFDRLVRHEFGSSAWVGSVWFATSTVTNLVVGRVTFALGVVFALAALLALQRGRCWFAALFALLCPLASPVAGLFLAVAGGGWGLARPALRVKAWSMAAIGIVPVVVVAAVFPSPGAQPYELWALGCDLALCALCIIVVPSRWSALRWAAGVYAVVLVATHTFATPLGGNVSRLNQYAVGPLLACVLWERRRSVVIALAIPLLFWQWFPTFDTIAYARDDPSTHAAYYQPVLDFIATQPHSFGRVEVPVTYRHWETAYLAPQLSLARGWERQLDRAYDPQFYAGTLDATTYRKWLVDNGVEYVALPDARLDDSSFAEARLAAAGQPYLQPVWSDAHWRVWKFTGYRGLVDGPARLETMSADAFTLHVTGPGTVTVRVHYSSHWAVEENGCTMPNPSGWLQIRNAPRGEVRVAQALRSTHCDVDT
jgi:hypothetical protein